MPHLGKHLLVLGKQEVQRGLSLPRRLTKRKVCPSCGFILPFSPENELKKQCPECNGELIVRKDDNPDTIKQRIADQGNIAIGSILDYYRDRDVLFSVDGERSIDEVDEHMSKLLEE